MILGIYGAGDQGREILIIAKIINKTKHRWENIIFIDDAGKISVLNDTEVITFEKLCSSYDKEKIEIVIAVGEPVVRSLLRNRLQRENFPLATLVHPSTEISEDAKIGQGTIICSNTFISCNVIIGENVLIQPAVYIGHDNQIGNDTVLSAYVCIAGRCRIGSETYIGLHVPIREKVVIGNSTIIGMGSVVVENIPEHTIALGNPARPVRNNNEHKVFR